MDKKSIIIFGKGPSVLRCTRDFVDQFDEIAICGYPVINDFFYNLIKDREIRYHFCNCGSYDSRYTNEINQKLKIKGIYNTNMPPNEYAKFLKNDSLFNKDILRPKHLSFFKRKYNLDPSTGIMCLKYILDSDLYNKIGLVGFDNFKMGEQTYFYEPSEYGKEAKRLINLNENGTIIIKSNGIYNKINGHDPQKSKKYMEDMFSTNSNINFLLISNEYFEYKGNLKKII